MRKKLLKSFVITVLFFIIGISSVNAETEPFVAVAVIDGEVIEMTESQYKEFRKVEDKKYEEAMKKAKDFEKQAIEKGLKIGEEKKVSSRIREIKPFNTGLWSSVSNVNYGSPYLNYSKRERVTPSYRGPVDISYGNSVSVSASANISFDKLKMAGLSFIISSQSNENFNSTFKISEGRIAHIEFIPRYRDITGYKNDYFDGTLLDRTPFRVSEPVNIGRFADGLYEIVYE